MFSPFDPVPQPPPAFSLKRTRSISPASLHKKRPGAAYSPACYTALPPHLARPLSGELNSVSASSSNSSGSGTSTPGGNGDWVQRTERLQLATPPPGERWGWPQGQPQGGQAHGGGAMDEDEGMGMHMDDEMDHQMDTSEPPRPAVSHSHSSFSHQHQHRHDQPTPLPPHHAPPLHNYLAGSPQADPSAMSRSSSSSSSSSMSLSHFSHQYPSSAPLMQPHPVESVPAPSAAQRKTGGGWKVTFGYRADCQKCIDRVEGHYSHVVSDDGVFARS